MNGPDSQLTAESAIRCTADSIQTGPTLPLGANNGLSSLSESNQNMANRNASAVTVDSIRGGFNEENCGASTVLYGLRDREPLSKNGTDTTTIGGRDIVKRTQNLSLEALMECHSTK